MDERLQKVIAHAGLASRREAEKMILDGRVKVNGEVIKEMGFKVFKNDAIIVDGKPLVRNSNLVYYLLNKPTGVISSVVDPKNRKTVIDLLEATHKDTHLYPVGRLDFDTAGLILITNDGELTYILTRPEYGVEREYLVRVKGIVVKQKVRDLRKKGIKIDDDHLSTPEHVHIMELDKANKSTLLSIVLTEGKNHEVRKIFETIGHPVINLTRIRYDFLTLEGVARGKYRSLTIHEIKKLYRNKNNVKN